MSGSKFLSGVTKVDCGAHNHDSGQFNKDRNLEDHVSSIDNVSIAIMQSSSDHRPCARAGSTPKKLRCGKSTLTSAQKHSFKSFVRGPICINVEGQDSQFWTEWWQSLQKQSELPRKDYEAKNLNLSLSDIGKDHKTGIGGNLIWLQTFMISSSDQSWKVSAQALQQRVVRTEYHLRWRPWLQVNVNILLTNLLFPCLILSRPAGQPQAPPSLGGKGGVRQSGASSCHPEVIQ